MDLVVHRRRVRLGASCRDRVPGVRVVDSWGLVDEDGVWSLLAGTPQGRRAFRADRVVSAELTDEVAHRPDDLALDAVWAEVVTELEARRSAVADDVLEPARLTPALRALVGRHCAVGDGEADGRVALRVAAHTARSVAEQLAGFGGEVQVLEPAEVRAELVPRHSR